MNNTTIKNSLLALGFMLLGTVAAQAASASATLTPQADVDIRSTSPNVGFNRNVLLASYRNANPTAGQDAKIYIRFQLPSDFGYATNATFTMTRAVARNFVSGYVVYGMAQGPIAGSPWNELTWPELDGVSPSATTWTNAPDNNTNSGYLFTSDAMYLGTFKTVATTTAGDSYSITNGGLLTFLNADTNGFVTVMIARTNIPSSSSEDQWASKENTTYAWPTLAIGYVLSTNFPARITTQPQPATQTVYETLNASFSATAGGSAPIAYQWCFTGANLVDGPHVSGCHE